LLPKLIYSLNISLAQLLCHVHGCHHHFETKFDEICDIDFTTPQSKRKLSDNDSSGERSTTNKKPRLEIPKPTEEGLRNHHLRLSRMKGKPILLSFVSELNESYAPKYISGALPHPLTSLYDKATLNLSFLDLLTKCDEIYNSVSLTVQQASRVEEDTWQQSNSKVWFEQRAGELQLQSYMVYYIQSYLIHLSL